MAEDTSAPPVGKNAGKGLKKKVAGLPLFVWLGVAVVGLGLGWYLRRNSSSSGSLAASPTDAASSGTDSGTADLGSALSGGGIASPTMGTDPYADSSVLGDIRGKAEDALTESDQNASAIGDIQTSFQGMQQAIADDVASVLGNVGSSGGSGASAAGKSSTSTLDKVVSRITLKSGAKVTTFASGRKVQSATPGKAGSKAYQISPAGSHPVPAKIAAHPATHAAVKPVAKPAPKKAPVVQKKAPAKPAPKKPAKKVTVRK